MASNRKIQPRKKVLPPKFNSTSSSTHQPTLHTTSTQPPSKTTGKPPSKPTAKPPSTTSTLPPSTTSTLPPSTTSTLPPSNTAPPSTQPPSSTITPSSTTIAKNTAPSSSSGQPPSTTIAEPSSSSSQIQSTTTAEPSSSTGQPPSTTIAEPSSSSSQIQSTTTAEPSSSTVVAPLTEWGECPWGIRATPSEAIIPSDIGYVFCYIHDSLLDVVPTDDIYSQLPSVLLLNRRSNLEDQSYAIHTHRHFNPNKSTNRSITNTAATWSNKKKMRSVAGKNGEVAGVVYPLVLTFKGKPSTHSMWVAEEYVSVNCKDGKSAVVVIKCRNDGWLRLEQSVYKAEKNLAVAYRMRVKAIDNESQKDIDRWDDGVVEYKRQLGTAILALQNERTKLLTEEAGMGEVTEGVNHGRRMTGGIVIKEPLDLHAGRVTGLVEPSDVLRPNTLGSAGYFTSEFNDAEEATGGRTSFYDRITARRAAEKAREKAKGKQKVTGGIVIKEPLDLHAGRVTGLVEPSDVLRPNTLGSAGYVTREFNDAEEATGGRTSFYDRRMAAERAREKAKEKQKVTEK